MAEFIYNNAKKASTNHTLFELNRGYHLLVFYKKNNDCSSKSKLENLLLAKLREVITVCQEILYHSQKL